MRKYASLKWNSQRKNFWWCEFDDKNICTQRTMSFAERINCKFLIYLFLPDSCDLLDSKLNTWPSQRMLQIDILARLKSLKCAIDPSTRRNALYVSVIGEADWNFREHSDDINKVPRDFSTHVEYSVSKIFKIRSLASLSRCSYVHRINFTNERTDHSDRRVFLPYSGHSTNNMYNYSFLTVHKWLPDCAILNGGRDAFSREKNTISTPIQSLLSSTIHSIPFLLILSRNASPVAATRSVKSLVTLIWRKFS